MLISAILYTFAPSDGDRAEAILHDLRELTRAEPGCVGFEVARSIGEPEKFALWEVYEDRAAYDAHVASDHFKRLGAGGIRPLATERIGQLCRPIA